MYTLPIGFLFFGFCTGLYIVIPLLWNGYQDHLFVEHNIPIVQQVIVEQCNLSDYQASDFHFDEHSLDTYYDYNYSRDLNINCYQDNHPDGEWNCTCEERESD